MELGLNVVTTRGLTVMWLLVSVSCNLWALRLAVVGIGGSVPQVGCDLWY